MPVVYQGENEYSKQYKWFGSKEDSGVRSQIAGVASVNSESQDLEPAIQHKKKLIVGTDNIEGNIKEPPLQHKKRPMVSKKENEDGGDRNSQYEYILLGKRDKFSQNVIYPARSKEMLRNFQKSADENLSGELSPPPAPRPNPPPKVIVNTGATSINVPTAPKSDQPPKVIVNTGATNNLWKAPKSDQPPRVILNTEAQTNNVLTAPKLGQPPKVIVSTGAQTINLHAAPKSDQPPKVIVNTGAIKSNYARTAQMPDRSTKVMVDTGTQKNNPQPIRKQDATSKAIVDGKRLVPGSATKGIESTTAQQRMLTNANNSNAATSEAGPNYALRYKSGLSRRPDSKRISEYQNQFLWRHSAPESPMLAAEEVIYKRNNLVPPFRSDHLPKFSEYQRQYKPWKVDRSVVSSTDGVDVRALNDQVEISNKKMKIKRSQSVGDMERKSSEADADGKLLANYALKKLSPFVSHHQRRVMLSEYGANYNPPSRYQYMNGSWKGAQSPYLDHKELSEDIPVSSSSSWFAEVVELRQKAAEYKQRAYGSHFSREHLGQLFSQQAELWDAISINSSLSALSLEGLKKEDMKKEHIGADGKIQTKAKRNVGIQTKDDDVSEHSGTLTPDQSANDLNSGRSATSSVSHHYMNEGDLHEDVRLNANGIEGRVPTPELRSSHSKRGYRHHLDRTTPSVGGTLLTSPIRKQTGAVNQQRTDADLKKFHFNAPHNDEEIKRKSSNAFEMTRDDIPHYEVEADQLSTSRHSLASSCSLASQVLERSKSRRDNFWTKAT